MRAKRSLFSAFAAMFAMSAMLKPYESRHTYSSSAFQPRERGIRNPKNPIKKASIERRRKAKKLSKLSKPKRRAVYYYNLMHPVKMYV